MESSSELELLRTMVERIHPKPSWYITVSGNTADISSTYSPPIEFPEGNQYEMAFYGVETFFSFPNIDETNNSITVNEIVLKLPIGCYEIDAINKYIKQRCKGVTIKPNRNTLKCQLILGKDAEVDFRGPSGTMRSVLGFNEKLYKGSKKKTDTIDGSNITIFESEHIVNILRVNSIFIHCDVIKSSRKNGLSSPVIYNFFPNVSPGYKIVDKPKNLIYLPITMNVISQMRVWLTDQNDQSLDLRGEELTISFHIRAC